MPKVAVLYTRVSSDPRGIGRSVAEQEADGRVIIDRKGWALSRVFTDNDRGASRFSNADRPAWRELVEFLRSGGADVLVTWEASRAQRDLDVYLKLRELCRENGVLWSYSGRTYDLSRTDDAFTTGLDALLAERESSVTRDRVLRAMEANAMAGKAHGGGTRPFGFEADRVTVNEAEADLIREAAQRVLSGDTLHHIAHDWNARGIRPVKRDTWTTSSLSRLLRAARIAGLRRHRGEIVGDAVWPAIVDRATWEAVCARLASGRSRGPGRPTKRLLVGIARCGRCGGPLWSAARRTGRDVGQHRYACASGPGRAGCGGITISAERADDEVRDRLVARLSGPALAEARKRVAGQDRAQQEAVADLADAEQRLEDVAGMFADGSLSRREWLTAREKLEQRIAAARRVLDRGDNGALADLPTDADALRAVWEAGDVDWRRAVLQAVVDRIEVRPSTRPGPVFDPDRIAITWKA